MAQFEPDIRVSLLTADGAGAPGGAGTDAAFWGEAAWTARDLRDFFAAAEPEVEAEPEPALPPAVLAARPRRRRSTGKLKAVLTLLLLAGVLSSVLPNTLASFSAETLNPNSQIASGTLTLSNSVNGATACLSNQASSNDNVNNNCDVAITFTNVAPGVSSSTATALITVKNTGSIDASKLWLWAPSVTPTLNAGLTSGNSVSSLTVTPLKSAVVSGQAVVVRSGVNNQTFYASAAASANATTISVTAQNANFSYPIGSAVQVVDCYDAKTTGPPAGAPNATYGSQLNYNSPAGNPLCGATLLYVQEVTGMTAGTPSTQNYCWTGVTYSSGGAGMCVAPIAVTLSSSISGSPGALPVTQLNGNVRSGDKILVTPTSGSPQTFTATADVYAGATSIPVSESVSGTLASGSAVTASPTDATGALAALNADSTFTLTKFDTLHDGSRGPIQLAKVTSNGVAAATTVTELPKDTARTFLVGIYLPAPTGGNQNGLQGLMSTFGLTWHIDQ